MTTKTKVTRVDRGRLALTGRIDSFKSTPTGGVIIPARIARTGVLVYRGTDGRERREYRSDAENAAAARTAEDAVVTVGHPTSGPNGSPLVTPANAAAVSVGHVKNPRIDGRFLVADLAITDGPTLARIDRGDLIEISMGYSCECVEKPGTAPGGERYDAEQISCVVNHCSLLPKGAGRAGPEVALRLDGGEYTLDLEADELPVPGLVRVLVDATRLAPGARFDSARTERDLRVAALAIARPSLRLDGKSDDYVAGMFDAFLELRPADVGDSEQRRAAAFAPAATPRAQPVGYPPGFHPFDLRHR